MVSSGVAEEITAPFFRVTELVKVDTGLEIYRRFVE
jgi:hypothetical protein